MSNRNPRITPQIADWRDEKLPVRPRALPPAGVIECWLMDVGALELAGAQPGGQVAQQALKLRRRFLLRLILGAYLGLPGKDLSFVPGPSGKPGLARKQGEEQGSGGLNFNLSHSGDWLAVAVARDVEVGIDIERDRVVKRAGDLARRYFSDPEAEHLAALSEPERSAQFLRLWTVREACTKALGSSLARSLRELKLAPDSADLLAVPVDWPGLDRWSVLRVPSPAALNMCVAAPESGMLVRPIRLDCSPP